ncbi:MAG TPA: L-fucose:H+ symporter permease [Candidatus Sulfotelmatobacter sp.]|nr:L-fucose:H+ symporter permease [Candidatus Sulfotelmatobacter sp.]
MITPSIETKPNAAPAKLFSTADGKNYALVFLLMCSLFLLWGFCSGLLDNLNKNFQNTLQLSKFQSGFVQNAFYMGYFFMALPAGLVARRFGYKGGIIVGLTLAAAGAFWFIPAVGINAYWAFLLGLFVLASGLACLETIANPYTTVLGPPESGATRINMAQTCNGLGWILGMFIGGHVILSATTVVNTSNEKLYIPYLGIGVVVAVLLFIFVFAKVPDLRAAEEFKAEAQGKAVKPLFARSHFTFGVVAQFLYVAAQTGIFSFFINYAVANINNLSDQSASNLQSVAFALFAGGRLIGSAVVGLTKPHKALAIYAAVNTVMVLLAMAGGGWPGVIAVMASFFFMSIMFPTIFALSIRGLGEHTKFGSSLLVMSIVGGAIMTPIMGKIADIGGMRIGFVIPLICFVVIAVYGAVWQKLESKDSEAVA